MVGALLCTDVLFPVGLELGLGHLRFGDLGLLGVSQAEVFVVEIVKSGFLFRLIFRIVRFSFLLILITHIHITSHILIVADPAVFEHFDNGHQKGLPVLRLDAELLGQGVLLPGVFDVALVLK